MQGLSLRLYSTSPDFLPSNLCYNSSMKRCLPFALAALLLTALAAANAAGIILPNGWHLTPAGTLIPLPGDMPLKMLFSPDGKYLVVNTGGWHDHSVNLIDPATSKLV